MTTSKEKPVSLIAGSAPVAKSTAASASTDPASCDATSGHSCGHNHSGGPSEDFAEANGRQFLGHLLPVVLCGTLMLAGAVARFVEASHIADVLFILSALAGGWPTLLATLKSLARRKLDVDFLMLGGAAGASIVGHYDEAAILLFLFTLSALLETYAMGRTRRALKSLMKLRPDEARVLRNGEATSVPTSEVQIGDIVILNPGERIPLDGIVRVGEADLDESALTGESLPRWVTIGNSVLAGGVNLSGALQIEVERPASESTLSRIVELVEHAHATRGETQRLIDRYVSTYAMLITGGVVFTALVPPLLGWGGWSEMFYRAMTIMVVASPCALVISTPATILSTIAAAARRGILFKGGAAVEQLGQVDTVAFDKTGTLTRGQMTIHAVESFGQDEAKTLGLAAAAESSSEHPLARAIVAEARKRGIGIPPAEKFHSTAGLGVTAQIDGRRVVVGSLRFLGQSGIALPIAEDLSRRTTEVLGKSIWVAAEGELIGRIVLADEVRPEAAKAVRQLRQLGIRHVEMLTGDERHEADRIAALTGIEHVSAALLPEEKVEKVRQLSQAGGGVAMVGDGINDAPALANANVGIAMGAAGTDLAIESAAVVLMSSDLGKLTEAVELSRKGLRALRQNLVFSILVIVVLVIMAVLGRMPLSAGVVGHEGSTLLVIANGLRLLTYRGRALPSEPET